MVARTQVMQAARVLRDAAPAGSRVVLFGSQARGEARDDSDADFLVVEPTLSDRRAEMVRLRQALRPMRIAVDVVVVSHDTFELWRDTPNTLIFEAAREGLECD
jgi:uncharacterized protein